MVCNICRRTLNFGYNKCDACDYKLCPECFQRTGHVHEMKFTLSLIEEPLIKSYIQMLLQKYRDQDGSNATAESLFVHIRRTRLICDCIFCKQLYLIYVYHTLKCSTPGCVILRCPVVNEYFLKKRLSENQTHDLELLKATTQQSINENADPTIISAVLARKFTIQRCIRTLVHACHCLEPDCMPLSCQKMKRILAHIKVCKRKIQGGCTICTQLSTLCCFHAKNCKEKKCPVLLCSAYKRKLQENKKARVV